MKHKHSDVLHAFVDGIECECWGEFTNEWFTINNLSVFDLHEKVRIKPEPPKEQEQQYLYMYKHEIENTLSMSHKLDDPHKGWAYMGKVRVEK